MEMVAQINAIAPSADLPTKQARDSASPPADQGKKASPAQEKASDAQAPAKASEAASGPINNTSLEFEVYDKNKIAVTVVDKESGDTIREIPPEEIRRLAARMDEMAGNLVDEIA